MQIGGGEFRKSISAPTPWYQNPCDASIFLHARPIFREKKSQNLTLFRALTSQNIRTYSKDFICPNVFGYRLGIAKISLKNLNSFLSYLEKNLRVKMTPLSPLTLSYPGGGYAPLLFFLHHPKTAQGIKLKLSDFKDTLLRQDF